MTFYEIFSDCNFKEEARTAIPEDWEFVCIESTDRYQVYMCEASNVKVFHSEGANYLIALDTGLMISWGKTFEEDPGEFPVPNILDWEVTTICKNPAISAIRATICRATIFHLRSSRKCLTIFPSPLRR